MSTLKQLKDKVQLSEKADEPLFKRGTIVKIGKMEAKYIGPHPKNGTHKVMHPGRDGYGQDTYPAHYNADMIKLKESRGHTIIANKLKTMEFLKKGGITKKEQPKVDKAHMELDKEIHMNFGQSSEEMK